MDLLISLGHNSSAIGVDEDGNIIAGYEEERFSRKKSDSNFPTQSVLEILKIADEQGKTKPGTVYISHWYDNFNFLDNHDNSLHPTYSRHINWDLYFDLYRAGFKFVLLNKDFTHHDAHAWSAISFLRNHIDQKQIDGFETHIYVCDGFGNNQEVFTVYRANFESNKVSMFPIFRIRGYDLSMGLMYQYATSFLGLKENKDEYKLLGFESYIKQELTEWQINFLIEESQFIANMLFEKALTRWKGNYVPNSDDVFINIKQLTEVKKGWYELFRETLRKALVTKENGEFKEQVALSFFVQSVLENFHNKIIEFNYTKNLLLAGGVYFNVKLNNQILKKIPGKISIMPLAGDQGCGIGMYEKNNYGKLKFDSLLIGKRKLSNPFCDEKKMKLKSIDKIAYDLTFNMKENSYESIAKKINENQIVNVVTGAMEFGPRALCNTSTIFKAKKEMTQINNLINDRNEVMPVCPVILEENAHLFFKKEDIDRIIGSLYYMIIAIDYSDEFLSNEEMKNSYDGVLHNYPLFPEKFTGRPQLINEKKYPFAYKLLKEMEKTYGIKCLVNTSFNFHGVPIVYDSPQALDDFRQNIQQKINNKLDTVVNLFVGDSV